MDVNPYAPPLTQPDPSVYPSAEMVASREILTVARVFTFIGWVGALSGCWVVVAAIFAGVLAVISTPKAIRTLVHGR